MFKKIIVGHDMSEQSADAVAFARRLARLTEGEVTLVGVTPAAPPYAETVVGGGETLEGEVESRRQQLAQLARSLALDGRLVRSRSPAQGLSETAAKFDADLIVVGSCKWSTLGRVLVGSVGRTLLAGAPCAVAVAPSGYADRPEIGIRRIGVGYDGTPEARAAVDAALEVAQRAAGELDVIRVVEPLELSFSSAWAYPDPGLPEAVLGELRAQLARVLDELPDGVRTEGRLVEGPVAVMLAQLAEDEALDVLFTGSRGYGEVRGVLAGSASAGLIRSAPCPVVVLPRQVVRRDTESPASASAVPVL